MMEFFASASAGTELVLRDELQELGMGRVRVRHGGVEFLGCREDSWRACLSSRIAQRIMQVVHRFDTDNEKDLYEGVRAVDWKQILTPAHTLSVAAHVHSSHLTHSGFAALRAKDAIVDRIRADLGARPDVDRDDPDVRVFLHLYENHACVYLDVSGRALFMRGYRTETGAAPLKETLAAALLRMAGWDRESPLIDPMCGSGTIAIEAALWAGNRAPGLARDRFGFERWADFSDDDTEEMRRIRGEIRAVARGRQPRIMASDISAEAVRTATDNARRAGVRISIRHLPLHDLSPDGQPRLLVTNPPYDQRLEADNAFYQEMTAVFQTFTGWRICILSGSPLIEANMGLKPVSRTRVRNGALPCDVLVYDIP